MSFFRILERFMLGIETIAGVLLGLVTLLIVVSAVGRYVLAVPVPDSFDMSRFLVGAAIMWGFASVGYRGSHIKVDLLSEMLPPRSRRIADFVAWAALLGFTVLLVWKMSARVASAFASGEATFDLRIPAWPMLALITAGAAVAIATIAARLLLIGAGRGGLDPHEAIDLTPETDRRTDVER